MHAGGGFVLIEWCSREMPCDFPLARQQGRHRLVVWHDHREVVELLVIVISVLFSREHSQDDGLQRGSPYYCNAI